MSSKSIITAEFLCGLNSIDVGHKVIKDVDYDGDVLNETINELTPFDPRGPGPLSLEFATRVAYNILTKKIFTTGNLATAFLAANQVLREYGSISFVEGDPRDALECYVDSPNLCRFHERVARCELGLHHLFKEYSSILGISSREGNST